MARSAVGNARAQGWTEHHSEDGNFHVEMPGTPSLSTTPLVIGKDETAPLNEAMLRTPSATYQAIYIAYSRRVATAASADVLLDTFRTNMTAGLTRRGDTNLTLGRPSAARSRSWTRTRGTSRSASTGVAASSISCCQRRAGHRNPARHAQILRFVRADQGVRIGRPRRRPACIYPSPRDHRAR